MNNMINWFEIPVTNISRAIKFYSTILNIDISETDMFGTKMGVFPSDGTNVSGALVQGEGYIPSTSGTTVYLNGGDDLSTILIKVEVAGGSIMVNKTIISEEMGFFALFVDSEGNKVALHSIH